MHFSHNLERAHKGLYASCHEGSELRNILPKEDILNRFEKGREDNILQCRIVNHVILIKITARSLTQPEYGIVSSWTG